MGELSWLFLAGIFGMIVTAFLTLFARNGTPPGPPPPPEE